MTEKYFRAAKITPRRHLWHWFDSTPVQGTTADMRSLCGRVHNATKLYKIVNGLRGCGVCDQKHRTLTAK